MAIAALTYYDARDYRSNAWGSVRKFINIAGGIRGLGSCYYFGPINPYFQTCNSEDVSSKYIFGFYPDPGPVHSFFNEWTGGVGVFSLRRAPIINSKVLFYTIHAGKHDQIHCTSLIEYTDCDKGALFYPSSNVKSQLNIGVGSTADRIDFNFEDWSPFVVKGGDADGVGHFKAKNNSGEIIYKMLNSDCEGILCKGSYTGGPVVSE